MLILPVFILGTLLKPTSPSLVIVQYPLGRSLSQEIPPREFWRTQFYMPQSQFVKFNFSVPSSAVIAVYGRKNIQPSHAQYDFMQVIDGPRIHKRPPRAIAPKVRIVHYENIVTSTLASFLGKSDSTN